MKLGLIIHTFYPAFIAGGPIYSTLNTSKELSKLGVVVNVSTSDLNCTEKLNIVPNVKHQVFDNIFVTYYSETRLGRFSFSCKQAVGLWKDVSEVDMVHVQGVFNLIIVLGLYYAVIQKKKVVLSPRGSLGTWVLKKRNFFKKIWLKLLIKNVASKINWHATSNQEKDEIQFLFPDAEVHVIPNGIDLNEYKTANVIQNQDYMYKYTKMKIDPQKIIISMGRIQKKKGFDILINSLKQVKNYYPDTVVLIAGEEEDLSEHYLEELETLCASLLLKDSVFFVGHISGQDKVDYLANADLFVLPSHNENFGNVYAESLAAGTPIVASKFTPWQEVIQNGCGAWVDNDVDSVTQAILELFDKDKVEMATRSQNYISRYSWTNIANEFKLLYERLL